MIPLKCCSRKRSGSGALTITGAAIAIHHNSTSPANLGCHVNTDPFQPFVSFQLISRTTSQIGVSAFK